MILLLLLLSGDVAVAGDELVVADKVIRFAGKTFGEPRVITAIAVSPDGTKVAEVGGKAAKRGRLAVWDLKSGKQLWSIKAHRELVYDVIWSHDGKRIYTAGGDKGIGVYDAGGKQLDTLLGHAGPVISLAISTDGTLASGSTDRAVRIWKDGETVRRIQNHHGRVTSLAFRGDGRYLASGSSDGTVRLWQHERGRLVKIIRGHNGEVLSLVWKGEKLVTGCADGKVRVVDTVSAKVEQVVRDHEDWVESVVLRGEKIVSMDAEGRVKE